MVGLVRQSDLWLSTIFSGEMVGLVRQSDLWLSTTFSGEMVGLVRQSDRGGPAKFKAYVDAENPNKGKIIRDVWKKGDMCFRYRKKYAFEEEHI
jgi:hypothetical protein